jgi:Eco57I restriction-modification methylase/restriction-modification enzyme MmeI-like protein
VSRRVASIHADWLTIVEPSGPFLTLPVLRRVWPNGLDHLETETRAEVRRHFADLDPQDVGSATKWIEWVLRDLFEYGHRLASGPAVPATLAHVVAEHATVLRPDYALVEPVGDGATRARLLVTVHPPGTRLDARPADAQWSATPIDRLALLCRATGVELGLATNATAWVLVWAPRNAAMGRAIFSADLFSEEPVLLDAFTSVLGARRFFAAAEGDRLEQLLAESASAQAEVTGKLGQQVRQAVELLVGAMSRANRERDGALLTGIEPHQVYEAAVGVLMRCVFLLYAEEQGLLPLGDDLYDRTLAASTLLDQLREIADLAGDEPLERSTTAWHRLLALFRAVHGGIAHDLLRIPAYGGGLFDPDRFPFLEGRRHGERWHDTPATPLPVDDLTVLAMLAALQELRFSEAGVTETRRLTYRSLDVEQIGHVYEGLLDHSAVKLDKTAVGLIGKAGIEPEVALDDLTAAAAQGREGFVAWLSETTTRTARQLERLLDADADADTLRLLRAACDNDEMLTDRLTPYVHVIRPNLRGLPTVFPAGTMYVTQTGAKRDSGTAYTTRDLAEELVEHALEPLVYEPGPAEGTEPADWKLRSAHELLGLKVCDPAVGSGAILVAACRYLAKRLVEAWILAGMAEAEGDPHEVFVAACRAVADRCVYGVDRDPMAVEMAKLSLWLVTLSKERPFSFLDHALKAGDSLLGITDLEQLRHLHMDPAIGRRRQLAIGEDPAIVDSAVERAVGLRRELEAIPVRTVRDAEEKSRLDAAATSELHALRIVADLVVGNALRAELPNQHSAEDQIAASAPIVVAALDPDQPAELRVLALEQVEQRARQALDAGRPDSAPNRKPLHWPLAFPEVFVNREREGFDAMVGNPPFLHGQKITGTAGTDLRQYVIRWMAGGRRGSADLVAYFFLKASQLATSFGFLATNTIAQGDTREVALDQLTASGWTITRAVKSTPWPGTATLEIAKVWLRRKWVGVVFLDGDEVTAITPSLDAPGRATGNPLRLAANQHRSFQGSIVLGLGFVLTPDQAKALIETDPRNADVLFPYLSGEDLNASATQQANRWVINFFDWPEDVARRYRDCWAIVQDEVRPERQRRKEDGSYVLRRPLPEKYWIYAEKRPGLYSTIASLNRAMAVTIHSKTVTPSFVPINQVYAHGLIIFAYDDYFHFGVLNSALHWWWAVKYGSTIRTDLRYTSTDVFETFPQPPYSAMVEAAGRDLDERRSALMIRRDEGLTKTYNRVHDPEDTSLSIQALRELHVALDIAVRDAYGWSDLELDHDFHNTPQGRRFTLGPSVHTEVLDRLLELNHRRYAEEVAAGLHDTKVGGKTKRRKPVVDAPRLL